MSQSNLSALSLLFLFDSLALITIVYLLGSNCQYSRKGEGVNTAPVNNSPFVQTFREMKTQPSLERALKHKEILGA